jgi:hypothetical protein
LALHHPKRLLNAKEHAGQIRIDDGFPPFKGQILERHCGRADAGVVE